MRSYTESSYSVKEERQTTVTELESYDYIVVGSGAGGGPLAASM